jgi:predicted SAM-dependent methyltransferase
LFDAISKRIDPSNYVTADIQPERYGFSDCQYIDLCSLESWPSNHYDLIIHSHVLEHTPCNIAYTLYHLHRMLSPSGWNICVIPFTSGYWDEKFQNIGDEEKVKRFGQFDHVRRFGRGDI